MEEEEELIEFMSGDYDKEEVEEEEGEFMSWDYDKLRRPAPSGRPAQPFTMELRENDKDCLLLRRPAPSGRPAQPFTPPSTVTPNYCWKTPETSELPKLNEAVTAWNNCIHRQPDGGRTCRG